MICKNCNYENNEENNYCISCGHPTEKKYDFFLYKTVLLVIVLIAFLVILRIGVGSPINLTSDSCYMYNYSYLDYQNISTTINQSFCCPYSNITVIQNITANCTNTTITLNITNFNVSNLNLNLTSGETLTGTKENCNYSVSCRSSAYSNGSVCSLSKSLTGGQSYYLSEGSCNVNLSCQNIIGCESYLNETYNYPIEAVVSKQGDILKIIVFNESRTQNLSGLGDFTIPFQTNFRCPMVSQNIDENINFSFQQCERYLPLLSNAQWLEAFGKYIDNTGESNRILGDLSNKTFDIMVNVTALQNEVNYYKLQLDACVNTSATKQGTIDTLEDENKNLKIKNNLKWFIIGFLIIVICILLYKVWDELAGGYRGDSTDETGGIK